jgi:hypothetical protein
VPVLTVSGGGPSAAPVTIESAQWKGLRLRVELAGEYADAVLDIRVKPEDAGSSLLLPGQSPRKPGQDGRVSLPADDDRCGAEGWLVVLLAGSVVGKQRIKVPED